MPMNEWPADRVERWPIKRLIPYARNAPVPTDHLLLLRPAARAPPIGLRPCPFRPGCGLPDHPRAIESGLAQLSLLDHQNTDFRRFHRQERESIQRTVFRIRL